MHVYKVDLTLIDYMINDVEAQIEAGGPAALSGALGRLKNKKREWGQRVRSYVAGKTGTCQEAQNRNLI